MAGPFLGLGPVVVFVITSPETGIMPEDIRPALLFSVLA
jgi:hypothetical protein